MKYKYLKRIGIPHNDILYTLYNSNLIKPYIDYTGYRLKYPTINLYVDNSIIYSNIFYYTVMNVGYMLTSFVLQFKYFNDKNEEMIRLTKNVHVDIIVFLIYIQVYVKNVMIFIRIKNVQYVEKI